MQLDDALDLVTGDTLPELTFTLKDSNQAAIGQTLDPNDESTWAPIDLTGATVQLLIRRVGESTLTATITCSIQDAPNGVCRTDFPASAFPEAGTYEGEIEITFPGGGVQTIYETVRFRVREDFN